MDDKKTRIKIPGKGTIVLGEEDKTTRTKTREKEDNKFTSVIVKRIDEGIRHPDDILAKAIHEGLEQHKRSEFSLFISAIAAGLILGFAGMLVALASQAVSSQENVILARLATALVYPLGFIICVMSGTQLFTEHTAMAVYPVLDKKVSYKSLLKILCIILIGNIFGTFQSSILLYFADPVINAKEGFLIIFEHLVHYSFFEVFASAILAGWLMAQGGWLILSSASGSAQIVFIFIVTFTIGLGNLHHSIAGSSEIFSGLFHSEARNYIGSFKFLSSAILGNFVGGSLFVAILNYGHIKKTQ